MNGVRVPVRQAGGYYDHMVPPSEGVPWDESPCWTTPPGQQASTCGEPFDFRRLGLRTTSMLLSPWVPKGAVFQEPKGPTATSQFDETSILATAKNLFGLTSFLTKRDAWAGSFDELLLDEPRTDCPMHFPAAPDPATPWTPPPPAADSRRSLVEGVGAEDGARHCSSPHGAPEQACAASAVPSRKQRKTAHVLAAYLEKEPPNLDAMSHAQADEWIGEHWQEWLEKGTPVN